jgi:hypothetical protein
VNTYLCTAVALYTGNYLPTKFGNELITLNSRENWVMPIMYGTYSHARCTARALACWHLYYTLARRSRLLLSKLHYSTNPVLRSFWIQLNTTVVHFEAYLLYKCHITLMSGTVFTVFGLLFGLLWEIWPSVSARVLPHSPQGGPSCPCANCALHRACRVYDPVTDVKK